MGEVLRVYSFLAGGFGIICALVVGGAYVGVWRMRRNHEVHVPAFHVWVVASGYSFICVAAVWGGVLHLRDSFSPSQVPFTLGLTLMDVGLVTLIRHIDRRFRERSER